MLATFIQSTASLLHAVMVSEIRSTFYKINVHAALTPEKIWDYLKPAIDQANKLKEAYKGAVGQRMSLHLPFVTVSVDFSLEHLQHFVMLTLQVFLDEVNTSSCMGLFKEIILDRTFDGVVYLYMYKIILSCLPVIWILPRVVLLHIGNSRSKNPEPPQTWYISSTP